jgi:hypothetical protein
VSPPQRSTWGTLPIICGRACNSSRFYLHFQKYRITDIFLSSTYRFALQKTDTGYIIPVPNYTAEATQTFTWTRDIGSAAVALLRNYADPSKNILGKAFPVVTAIMTYPEVATKISACGTCPVAPADFMIFSNQKGSDICSRRDRRDCGAG